MNILTSSTHFRQRVIKKSYKVGVTEAAKYYRISRNAIYAWRHKYDGKSWKSLVDKSHRPHHHPNEHTPEEKAMILKRYPYYKDDKAIRRIIRDCNDAALLRSSEAQTLLPPFSCHSLRHTFTTRLCEKGVNVKVIQDVLGHSDFSTTMDIYTDVTKDLKKQEFANFNLDFSFSSAN